MVYTLKASIGRETYKTVLSADNHQFVADEPEDMGGADLGPDPFELFLSSLAACKAMTMRMYADRKKWDLESVKMELSLEVKDSDQQQTTYINVNLELFGDLDDQQRQRILAIADKCPIHKVMQNPIVIHSNLITR